MELANIRSLDMNTEVDLSNFDTVNLSALKSVGDCLVTTDDLKLIYGNDLVDKAIRQGVKQLPLRRIAHIRPPQNFPKRVLLELTTHCNSLCTMCPRNVLTRRMQHMDTALAKDAISQLAEVGISGLWLYNIGESLLHPDIFEIIEYCGQFDSLGTLWLSTNGEIMSEEFAGRILDSPLDVLNYSVNAMSEENFEKIAPQLHFHTVQENLHKLLQLKKDLGRRLPLIRAQMIRLTHVLHEVDEFIETYGGLADIISINEWEEFSQNVDTNLEKVEASVNEYIPSCNRLDREDFFIFSDGSVSCCDTDFNCALNLGNIKEQTIQHIYDGEVYKGLLDKYRSGHLHEVELCSRCKDFSL